MTEVADSEVAAADDVEKPRRRVRKVSPKPTSSRGRSPTGEPTRRREKLPTNSPRRSPTSPTPSSSTTRKNHATTTRTKCDRAPSPKRSDTHKSSSSANGRTDNDNNNNHSSRKERSPVRKLSPKRATSGEGTGAGDGKNNSSTIKSRAQSPKRSPTDESLQRSHQSLKSATSRGRSPNSSPKRRNHPNSSGTTGSEKESPTRRKEGSNQRGSRSPNRGVRKDTSPSTAITFKRSGGKSPASSSPNKPHKSRPKKKASSNSSGPAEPSLELEEALAANNETDEESVQTEGSPRYVSAKGHSTHLQLDLSTIQGGGNDMPVFSLLDDNSLLDGGSTDGEGTRSRKMKNRNPKLNNPHRDSLLDNLNGKKTRVQKRLSQTGSTAPDPLVFRPWTYDDHDEQQDACKSPSKNSNDGSSSPKIIKSPVALTKAVKALKYTTNMAGASNFVGKMTNGFWNSNQKHQHMEDEEDDLDCLLSS